MLPADIIAEITTNLAALQLESNTAAQILAAVFAPLLRTGPNPDHPIPKRPQKRARAGRLSRRTPRRKTASKRRAPRPAEARERARAALKANPDASLTAVAKLAKVSRSTVVNARDDLRKPRETSNTAKPPTERRQRAQQFLKDALARGPKRVSDVEEAATRAHVDPQALEQARADLGIVTSRSNAGGVQAVQWSLPG